jgi:tetratricopeptide (TPR) repeat protein
MRGNTALDSPEAMLRKASLAKSPKLRAKYARLGLGSPSGLDPTTQAMLLRQLYLSHMEGRSFQEALDVADQMVSLGVMPDVARQDAARACLGLGQLDRAIEELRLASRASPPARRAFHLWTLGSVLHWSGRARQAVGVLERAVRWGTTDRSLYQAQLAIAQLAAGEEVVDLAGIRERLEEAPVRRGYGEFLLGEISFHLGDHEAAESYLRAFLRRVTRGRVALGVALGSEIARARALLHELKARPSSGPS